MSAAIVETNAVVTLVLAWVTAVETEFLHVLQLRLEDAIERVVYPKVSFNSVIQS